MLADGNKRVAVTMTAAFLQANGYQLEFNGLDAFSFLLDLTKRAECGSRNLIDGFGSTLWLPNHPRRCALPLTAS